MQYWHCKVIGEDEVREYVTWTHTPLYAEGLARRTAYSEGVVVRDVSVKPFQSFFHGKVQNYRMI